MGFGLRIATGWRIWSLALITLWSAYGCVWHRAVKHGVCDSIGPQLTEPTQAAPRNELHVLALSAGGPWGAFGAGFLNGWSELGDASDRQRPAFDIAIGVSTGATMVTHAFLGSAYDVALRDQVLSLSTAEVFERRSIIPALLGNAVTDTAPLRVTLQRVITDQIVDRVADAWLSEGRRLAVIAVDLDCGNPELLDLTAVALQRDRPDRIERYIDFIMASAASPVAFPPIFIDGHMMVDGALRQHIPFPRQIATLLPETPAGSPPAINLYAIINSPLETYPECVTDHVVTIALRTTDVWTGERAADSVALTLLDGQRRGWDVRFVAPLGAPCTPIPPREDYFQQSFMRCQYDYGYRLGSGQASSWQTSVDALPSPDAAHGPHPCSK